MSTESITLTLDGRAATGKAVKNLRRQGIVPAVIHNHGKDSVLVQGDYIDLIKVYRTAGKHHPIVLKAPGHTYTVLIKDATFEPKKNQLTHLVFNAVSANQKVEAEVPVKPQYDGDNESSPAERASLIVLTNLEQVLVEAVPSKLPDVLYYNAETLVEAGDHITVADLVAPDGVEIKTEADHAIATVYEPSAVAAANDDAGGDVEASVDDVESDHESGAQEGTQDSEIRPGGKEQKESKDQGRNPEKQ